MDGQNVININHKELNNRFPENPFTTWVDKYFDIGHLKKIISETIDYTYIKTSEPSELDYRGLGEQEMVKFRNGYIEVDEDGVVPPSLFKVCYALYYREYGLVISRQVIADKENGKFNISINGQFLDSHDGNEYKFKLFNQFYKNVCKIDENKKVVDLDFEVNLKSSKLWHLSNIDKPSIVGVFSNIHRHNARAVVAAAVVKREDKIFNYLKDNVSKAMDMKSHNVNILF